MRKVAVILLGVVVIGVLSALQPATPKEELAHFEITVTVTKEGVELKSSRGCAWKEANYSSTGTESYSFTVDEHGVGGLS
jgi:hypothetical protein